MGLPADPGWLLPHGGLLPSPPVGGGQAREAPESTGHWLMRSNLALQSLRSAQSLHLPGRQPLHVPGLPLGPDRIPVVVLGNK